MLFIKLSKKIAIVIRYEQDDKRRSERKHSESEEGEQTIHDHKLLILRGLLMSRRSWHTFVRFCWRNDWSDDE